MWFLGSSKLEFYTFYYHPKDFVGFTFLGHRGLFIPSLSLSTPALKGYTQHIHIGMATNSRVWVTEGRFHYKFYSQSPIKLGLVSTKLDLGYRLLISRVSVPKFNYFFYQISWFWQVVSDGKADFKLADPVQADLASTLPHQAPWKQTGRLPVRK